MPRAVLLGMVLAIGAAGTRAQEIEPRAYSNIPVGVNFLVTGYGWSSGGLVSDPSLDLQDADLRTDAMFVAYARGIGVGGRSGKIDAIVPFAWLSGTAEYAGQPVRRSVSGLGDPRLRLSVNLLGAPALSVRDLQTYRQDTIVGASVQMSVPVGQYDAARLVNIGTNRWTVKAEVGVSKAIGPWTLEFVPAVTLFDDNDDFRGDRTREQDPVYSIQGGVVYGFARGAWVALSGTYYTGGRTTVDGVAGDDLQKNSLAGVTVALPVNRNHSVKIYASTGLATRIGTDADTLGVAWQYRWGAGL